MKKVLILFMLLTLPLQSIWAAASTYCQHERGPAAQHFGHHDHQHKASADVRDQGHQGGKKFDPDCGYHHAADFKTVLISVDHAVVDTVTQFSHFHPGRYAFLAPDKPERPKWPAAA